MISKKILALVLALSVIVCAFPAFSVSADEAVWPDVEETLVNPTVWFNNGLSISLENASSGLKASINNGIAKSEGMKVSGTITFGDDTITLTDYVIRDVSSSNVAVTGWGSAFVACDPEFVAKLEASDAPDLERDENDKVITVSSGDNAAATIRNFVRYMLNKQDVDYSALTDDELLHTRIDADSALLTFQPYTAELLEVYPEGTLLLPTTTDYMKYNVTSDFKTSNKMYVPVAEGVGYGPYAVYKINQAGEYKVWLLKRDQYSDPNTAQRDVYLDINEKTFAFTNVDGAPAAVDNANYYMSPEDNGQTITVEAGEEFMVRVNNKTSVWSGSFGLLLVPAASADSVTVTGTKATKADSVAAFLANMVSGKVEAVKPNTKSATVNVAGTDVLVTDGVTETYYPGISHVDANGKYIDDVTLLDAVVAATAAGVELPFKLSLGEEIVSDKVTPINYDTLAAANNIWPTNTNGNGYSDLWAGTEIFCTNSQTAFNAKVTAPKAGNYYMFANGCGYSDNKRYLTISVNGSTVEEAAGDTQFFYNVDKPTLTVTAAPIALTEGENIVSLKTNGNWIRCSYVGFIEAESYTDAVELAEQITASKDAFNAYYAVSASVYSLGKITNFDGGFDVNGMIYGSDFDKVRVSEGDKITVFDSFDATNFAPINLGGKITGYGGRYSTDVLYNLSEDYSSKFIAYAGTYPFNADELDALTGCYLNGYITINQDLAGQMVSGTASPNTTGDDRLVTIYAHDWYIRHSAGNGAGRVDYGIKSTDFPNWSAASILADLDGDGTDEEYVGNNIASGCSAAYDFSHLYLTNSSSAADVKVTATEKSDGIYTLTSNKSIPVCLVRVTKADGVVISTVIQNTLIDFMDVDGITVTVADGETVYVWEGTNLPVGSTMVPLCAPLTK